MEEWWDESFKEQIDQNAYNTAPVEALVRFTSHFLRARFESPEQIKQLKFLEIGCGSGANLIWLAEKGIQPNGIDISQKALGLCKYQFQKKQVYLMHLLAFLSQFPHLFFLWQNQKVHKDFLIAMVYHFQSYI